MEYTNCNKTLIKEENSNSYEETNVLCAEALDRDPRAQCVCAMTVEITEDLPVR